MEDDVRLGTQVVTKEVEEEAPVSELGEDARDEVFGYFQRRARCGI